MLKIHRRSVIRFLLAAGGTLAADVWPRKPYAETLSAVAEDLKKLNPPVEAPDVAFFTADGVPHKFSEFRHRGMVVNMWATWCAPCVAEMPSLAVLSKALAPDDTAVLPLSSDHGGARTVESWFRAHEINDLPVLLDPRGAVSQAFKARGIPTTVIIDKSGEVVARLEGAADWSSPAAIALVKKLIGVKDHKTH